MLSERRKQVADFTEQLDRSIARLRVRAPVPPPAQPRAQSQADATHWTDAVGFLTGKAIGLRKQEAINLVDRLRKLQPDIATAEEVVRGALRLRRTVSAKGHAQ